MSRRGIDLIGISIVSFIILIMISASAGETQVSPGQREVFQPSYQESLTDIQGEKIIIPDLYSLKGSVVQDSVQSRNESGEAVQAGIEVNGTPQSDWRTESAEEKLSTELLSLLTPPRGSEKTRINEILSMMAESGQLRRTGEPLGHGFAGIAPAEIVYVYIWLNKGYPTSTVTPQAYRVIGTDEAWHLISAWVRVEKLVDITNLDAVRQIELVTPPEVRTGSVTTEGDAILKADAVRRHLANGRDGAGIKVGIISDGVDNLSESQSKGDLGAVNVLRNIQGGNEGTAMLEIVHDIAPGAILYFHDCGSDVIEFNHAITDLADHGCTVICDDIGWLNEPYFQDGVIATHVEQLIAGGDILYVSAAGNDAKDHFQGEFTPQPQSMVRFHDFSRGTNPALPNLYIFVKAHETIQVYLQWNDEWGNSTNDYNLFLKGSNENEICNSSRVQNGNDNPYEAVWFTRGNSDGWVHAMVEKKLGADNCNLEIFISGDNKKLYQSNLVGDGSPAEDSVYGHPAVNGVVAVAAIDAAEPGNDLIEDFSSQGPVTISWPAPESRSKPDISAIDGVRVTGAGGFGNTPGNWGTGSPIYRRFYGTSAAAPHAAGLAALLWSKDPAKTPGEIRESLYGNAADLGEAGKDMIYGWGRADVLSSYQALYPDPGTLPVTQFHALPTSGDPPLTVTFRDDSTGYGIDRWEWDFGMDQPSHFFRSLSIPTRIQEPTR